MFQFRLATLMIVLFASAILIWINTIPSEIIGGGHADYLNFEACYGWPIDGFYREWAVRIDVPSSGIPSDAHWRVNPFTIPVIILTSLALLGLIGFASENYFRRPPEDKLQLHYVTKMIAVLAACFVVFLVWIYYQPWFQMSRESWDSFFTNLIIRNSLLLSLPAMLVSGVVTEWILRLNKGRFWVLIIASLLPPVFLYGLLLFAIMINESNHYFFIYSDGFGPFSSERFKILPVVLAYGIYAGLFLAVTLVKAFRRNSPTDKLA